MALTSGGRAIDPIPAGESAFPSSRTEDVRDDDVGATVMDDTDAAGVATSAGRRSETPASGATVSSSPLQPDEIFNENRLTSRSR